ncbi:39S ribosomal protein L18, mitochondrial isoform X3 [Zootermopsis nevadensis]|uniref:39S ribosomal protein L18, mitochondrial isoform X3 n=1 Tax=Zootermopsis nevadensis TaxID=136037 RepID=UPI000B8ED3CC|nr:39S ribosomal protein L18, mitochondrial isoform X3 [Zootermopsis nevadensis]
MRVDKKKTMVSITSLLAQKAGSSYTTSPLIALASIATSVVTNKVGPTFYNRNPRNLERLRIAWRPTGYHLEVPGREFWHKLLLEQSPHHVTAKIVHYSGLEVVTASTKEWAVKKFLYSTKDTSAFMNLARVFAQRCLESGISEVCCDLKPYPGGKVESFLFCMEEGGMTLAEPPRFKPHRPWHVDRPEKPWEVTE